MTTQFNVTMQRLGQPKKVVKTFGSEQDAKRFAKRHQRNYDNMARHYGAPNAPLTVMGVEPA